MVYLEHVQANTVLKKLFQEKILNERKNYNISMFPAAEELMGYSTLDR